MMNTLNFPKTTWRLIRSAPADGPWNMAVDEAILETAGRGETLPTLRLYAWQPPCLSLGYAQPFSDVDLNELQTKGWHVVRRPTGGRAILHTDELTYSVCGPASDPRLAGSVLESYWVLAQALLNALKLLGISAQALEKKTSVNRGDQNPVCFEKPSNYEITVGGKKLIGSAQARRKEGVLQHGSLPLLGQLERIVQVLYFPDSSARADAAKRLLRRACTAEQILGAPLDLEIAAQAFVAAFKQTLNLDFAEEELSQSEKARAEALRLEKFSTPTWTEKLKNSP